ncbi:MAG: hypothetical protein WBF90_12620 [Rivularia sp. (in: cyanobacteria)]
MPHLEVKLTGQPKNIEAFVEFLKGLKPGMEEYEGCNDYRVEVDEETYPADSEEVNWVKWVDLEFPADCFRKYLDL